MLVGYSTDAMDVVPDSGW